MHFLAIKKNNYSSWIKTKYMREKNKRGKKKTKKNSDKLQSLTKIGIKNEKNKIRKKEKIVKNKYYIITKTTKKTTKGNTIRVFFILFQITR